MARSILRRDRVSSGTAGPRRSIHRMPVGILVLGTALAVAGLAVTQRVVASDDRQLLQQDASQLGLVFGSFDAQFETSLADIADNPAVFSGDPTALKASAGPGQLGEFSGVAVLQLQGGDLHVVSRTGKFAAPLDNPADPNHAQLRTAGGAKGFTAVGLFGTGTARTLGVSFGEAALTGDKILYAEFPLPEPTGAEALPGASLAGVDYAVYVGTDETPNHLLFATTRALPLDGNRAATVIDPASPDSVTPILDTRPGGLAGKPHSFLLVLSPSGHLTGALAGFLPWGLLGTGVVGTLLVVALVETSLRRRDQALRFVADLEHQNAALDAAMTAQRQAVAGRERVEAELRQAQRLEAVGQLAGGVAHDFNNLLAIIITSAGFMEEDLRDGPHAEDVDQVLRAARRAADLTRQLLIFSRREEVEARLLDPAAVVRELERMLRRTLGETYELVVQSPQSMPSVLCDAGELEQVIMNLAVNARDAMPDGGRIAVSLTHDTVAVVGEDVRPSDRGWVAIRVEDTGCGMSPEVATRAFEPFFTTKEVGRGTGLGLSTVYGIVTRWGGHIAIDSTPEQGTRVCVWLPVAAGGDAADVPELASRGAADSAAGETVMLVEDEAGLRSVTRRLLERAGYAVVEAPDGKTALELLGSGHDSLHVDVLVTDVVMPGGVSGHQLVDRVRELRPNLPVVLVSGYAMATDPPQSTRLVQRLAKPVDGAALLRAIRSSLGARTGAW